MDRPSASVIIPVYNRADCISSSIDSALNQQTDISYEVIVVDDGSTDDTGNIIKSYGEKVRLVQKDNGGSGSARNAGVKISESEIIVFLDSDDTARPDRIEKQVGYMLAHPDVDATFGGVSLEGGKNDVMPTDSGFTVLENPFGRLIGAVVGPMLWNASSAVRKKAYLDAGMQSEVLPCGEDFDFWCRASHSIEVAESREIFTNVGRSGSDHISYSTEAYRYKVHALLDSFKRHGLDLPEKERLRARKNLLGAIDSLLRNDWANGDDRVRDTLSLYADVMPLYSIIKWRMILLFVPSSVGRYIRTARRRFRARHV